MSRCRLIRNLSVVVATTLALSACSGGGSKQGSGDGDGGAGASCPVGALDTAKGTVEITFWHGLNRESETTLQRLTEQYNDSQSKVAVKLVNQVGYAENFSKWKAGLGTGDLPDVAQMEDTTTQQMVDTQSIVPVEDCITADGYDTEDFVPRILDRYRLEGRLVPMPFNVSNPVLYYDKNAFRAAGLDPNDPPTTLAAVKAAARKIKAAGYETGFGLKLNPWLVEQWAAKSGALYVNNQNGRNGRATKAVFGTQSSIDTFAWMKDMVDEGLALTNPDDGPNGFDNLLGIRSKRNGMTIDSSAALGTISQVLASGEGGGVELGVGPMPGPTGSGGILVGGGALYLSKSSAPEKIAAAWDYIKFLVQPDTQADFAASTGYVPIRESSITEPVLVDRWKTEPGYRVAYDQLLNGKNDVATAGPVIGDYQSVRDIVKDAETRMLTEGQDPEEAIAEAVKLATEAIQAYNARVG